MFNILHIRVCDADATILDHVPVPIVKFIKSSTYEGPPNKKIGDGAEQKAGTMKARLRGCGVILLS